MHRYLTRKSEILVSCNDTWVTIKRGWRGVNVHKEWALQLDADEDEELALEHVTALRLVLEKAEAEMVRLTNGDDPEILEAERRLRDTEEALAWKACIRFLVINELWETDYKAEAKGQEARLLWKDGSTFFSSGSPIPGMVCMSVYYNFFAPDFAKSVKELSKS